MRRKLKRPEKVFRGATAKLLIAAISLATPSSHAAINDIVGLSTAVGVSFGSGLIADAPESTLPEATPLL